MSGLTRRQARILRREIRKIYGQNYFPIQTGDSTFSIGDLVSDTNSLFILRDSNTFDKKLIAHNEGNKTDFNVISGKDVQISSKLEGQTSMKNYFTKAETGLSVSFTKENQMFLKLIGARQKTMTNWLDFEKHIISKYAVGELPASIIVVTAIVYADKYVLQFSGSQGGSINFTLDTFAQSIDTVVNADFKQVSRKNVGFSIDAMNGGVLAMRFSSIRLKKQINSPNLYDNTLFEHSAISLDAISFKDREQLSIENQFELVDITDSLVLNYEDEIYTE